MTIKNLTPHAINVMNKDNDIVATIPSGGIARASQKTEFSHMLDRFYIVRNTYGEPEGLPEYEEGVYYIVSLITANSARACGRTTNDLLLTSDLVRNEQGQIIGCREFAIL